MFEVLRLCMSPVKKTKIVYGCNLNFNIVNKYLDGLIELGYLQLYNKTYETTSKGYGYIQILEPAISGMTR